MEPPAESSRNRERSRNKELPKTSRQRRIEAKAHLKTLNSELKDVNLNDDLAPTLERLKNQFAASNKLYSIMNRKLDTSAQDARHLKDLTGLGLETSKRITVTTRSFDLRRIIRRLRRSACERPGEKMKLRPFFRMITEQHVTKFLCRPPTFTFFYGALQPEDLFIRKKTRRVREKIIEAKTVRAKEKNIEVDVEQDSTPKEVEYIYGQVEKLTKDKSQGVSFFRTVVDPKSFIQTVENIFHISFLVKDGKVGVKTDESKKAILTFEGNSSANREGERRANAAQKGNQSILSFSMDDYRNWISKYNVKSRAFAPRNDYVMSKVET